MLLRGVELTPIEAAQAFQTIASGGNRARFPRYVHHREDGKVVIRASAGGTRCSGAGSVSTLWTMRRLATRYGRQLGRNPNCIWQGNRTTNNNVDTWFAGIDGSTVTITLVTYNNQPKPGGQRGNRFISVIWLTRRQRR